MIYAIKIWCADQMGDPNGDYNDVIGYCNSEAEALELSDTIWYVAQEACKNTSRYVKIEKKHVKFFYDIGLHGLIDNCQRHNGYDLDTLRAEVVQLKIIDMSKKYVDKFRKEAIIKKIVE